MSRGKKREERHNRGLSSFILFKKSLLLSKLGIYQRIKDSHFDERLVYQRLSDEEVISAHIAFNIETRVFEVTYTRTEYFKRKDKIKFVNEMSTEVTNMKVACVPRSIRFRLNKNQPFKEENYMQSVTFKYDSSMDFAIDEVLKVEKFVLNLEPIHKLRYYRSEVCPKEGIENWKDAEMYIKGAESLAKFEFERHLNSMDFRLLLEKTVDLTDFSESRIIKAL